MPTKKSRSKSQSASQKKADAKLVRENKELRRTRDESLEREAATSDILRMIARSPMDLQSVLDAIAARVARLCDAEDAAIFRLDGNFLRLVAHFGPIPIAGVVGESGRVLDRGTPAGRAIIDRQTIHVHDLRAADAEFPEAKARGIAMGLRTVLDTPLLREGVAIGAIHIRRREVRPFSENQIKLLETFADQAVIAIENVRLFQELRESLEQQTATSQILGVIASSPTDIQPVLDAVAESAVRLCAAEDATIRLVDGNLLRLGAHYGTIPMAGAEQARPVNRQSVMGRAVVDRQLIHVEDLRSPLAETEFLARVPGRDIHTMLATPLLREGVAIGVIGLRRMVIRPFTDTQIALLKTFADQAVIAIENVRLFQELQVRNRDLTEALEQQTATGEVLRVIASSPTELQPVLDTLLANAVKLSGAKQGHIRQLDGEFLRVVAHYNESPERIVVLHSNPLPLNPNIPGAQAFLERKPIHVLDAQLLAAESQFIARVQPQIGIRTLLAVPLLREGTGVGTITIWRDVVEPFTDRQIELVKTFADQAVIAIENVRLFKELEDRNRQLTEALEQQTATSEILRVIASSPTNVQPVLDVVAQNASRLCEATDATINLLSGDLLEQVAQYGAIPLPEPNRANRNSPVGRAIVDQKTIHVHDLMAEIDTEYPESKTRQKLSGTRTMLVTPLLREGLPIGTINIRRTEVRPLPRSRSNCSKPLPLSPLSPSRMSGLFKEFQERNAELREALEHQTATAEVLGIISRSPTDVQPVLDAIVESAARVCGIDDVVLRLREGDTMDATGSFWFHTDSPRRDQYRCPMYRWVREHGTLHVPDVREQSDSPVGGSSATCAPSWLLPFASKGNSLER